MQSQMMGTQLQDQDYFYEILLLLKHQAREYTTAVLESSCVQVRQTMQRLLNDTLSEQADCYQIMARQGWYPAGPSANRQDVTKAIQTHRQDAQKNMQMAQSAGVGGQMGRPSQQQQQPWQSYQMSQQNIQNQQPWQAAQPWQYTQNWQDPSQSSQSPQQNQAWQPQQKTWQ